MILAIFPQNWPTFRIFYDVLRLNVKDRVVEEGVFKFDLHWSYFLQNFIRNSNQKTILTFNKYRKKFHQSWVQISYDCLENNLNDSYYKKAWFWHQEVAKIRQMQGIWSLKGSKSRFMLSYLKYRIKKPQIALILSTK